MALQNPIGLDSLDPILHECGLDPADGFAKVAHPLITLAWQREGMVRPWTLCVIETNCGERAYCIELARERFLIAVGPGKQIDELFTSAILSTNGGPFGPPIFDSAPTQIFSTLGPRACFTDLFIATFDEADVWDTLPGEEAEHKRQQVERYLAHALLLKEEVQR